MLAGLILGVPLAIAAGKLISSQLYGVSISSIHRPGLCAFFVLLLLWWPSSASALLSIPYGSAENGMERYAVASCAFAACAASSLIFRRSSLPVPK